jgi:hypothetical protein
MKDVIEKEEETNIEGEMHAFSLKFLINLCSSLHTQAILVNRMI